jgi:hypothetical protein
MIVISIFWTQKTTIRNLPELLDNYHKHGGSIVQYDRVFSIILYMQRSPKFEWVPPNTTRRAAGLKHALWCCLLGWWSITGFFATSGAIINNLMGGVDVTKVLTSPPPLPGQPFDNTALKELEAARRRQGYAFLTFLLILLLLVLALVWPYFKQL